MIIYPCWYTIPTRWQGDKFHNFSDTMKPIQILVIYFVSTTIHLIRDIFNIIDMKHHLQAGKHRRNMKIK